ncbi:MAG TPA: hypothetical protein VIV11_02225 [Kofleriaceae bacterium]
MKSLVLLICLVACTSNDGGTGPGPDDCLSDSCVCPGAAACDHACAPGGPPCHVQCSAGQSCDVLCEPSEECHVEASTSGFVDVNCNNSAECHVTCPASNCTVTNCVGAGCEVTCGLTGIATRTGTTATCP